LANKRKPAAFNMIPVSPADVIGRKIVGIRQCWKMNPDEGLDFAWSYLLLDSGLVIALRFETIAAETMAMESEPIVHRSLPHVYGQKIEQALLAPDRPGVYHDTPYLALANGWLVSDVPVAPHGVDGVGVLFFEPNELDTSDFRSLW
jgi:hypothetical protein